jgi:hypothetical protein
VPQTGIATAGLIAVFHGLQYLPFAFTRLTEHHEQRRRAWLSMSIAVAVGATVFYALPRVFIKIDIVHSSALTSALYLSLNAVHFYFETTSWKNFKNEAPAKAPAAAISDRAA